VLHAPKFCRICSAQGNDKMIIERIIPFDDANRRL
jgi:hypothetical protein